MENTFQHCDFCSKPITTGQRYGTLVYNVETYEQNAQNPKGVISVHDSEQVHIMCLQCGERYNRENVEKEMNALVNQGFKKVEAEETPLKNSAYYNSMDLEPDHVLYYLSSRQREPQNEYERKLLKQIIEIEKSGNIVEIPSN